ncbi:AmmeMemoRadiSam system protein B [Candidatus Poribacteria bacterium]|nr:MAG: AmmeMemoRadiSam system protein B [Candidatus Poribacteria bacterium]
MRYLAYALALIALTAGTSAGQIREPAAAGAFYPSDPAELKSMIEGFLEKAEVKGVKGEPVALIAPHAGYIYSGAVAAYAFKAIEGRSFDDVIIIGPSHHASFPGASVYRGEGYRTPLGVVKVDLELVGKLIELGKSISFRPYAHLREHCIEVELPFLQTVLKGEFKIVPILMSDFSPENCSKLSAALVKLLKGVEGGRKVLLIASSDMSHYPAYRDAVRVDRATIEAVKTLDPERIRENDRKQLSSGVPNLFCTLCGLGPVLVVIETAKKLGADSVYVLKYANSGDVPFGDKRQVVGYMAAVICKGGGKD